MTTDVLVGRAIPGLVIGWGTLLPPRLYQIRENNVLCPHAICLGFRNSTHLFLARDDNEVRRDDQYVVDQAPNTSVHILRPFVPSYFRCRNGQVYALGDSVCSWTSYRVRNDCRGPWSILHCHFHKNLQGAWFLC
jgi:hypothetical protein